MTSHMLYAYEESELYILITPTLGKQVFFTFMSTSKIVLS